MNSFCNHFGYNGIQTWIGHTSYNYKNLWAHLAAKSPGYLAE